MLNLEVTKLFILDLEEDFVRNKNVELYDFIKDDIVKAFWLGYHFNEWFQKLGNEKPYLYSKQSRHIIDYVEPYEGQIHYWLDKLDTQELTLESVAYVLDNLILENEEDLDKISFYFGTLFND